MKRILIIEDEAKVARSIAQSLTEDGYNAITAATGEEGYFLVTTEQFDVVVLDLMLPGRNGLDILTALRRGDNRTLVLILTARDAVEDRVLGLDSGADDYMVKPFAVSELLARIRVLLRRRRLTPVFRHELADLEIDLITRQVHRAERSIDLTGREFDLLACLMRHQGRFVTRDMIAREVWQETVRATPLDNVIDVHLARLRKKIDGPGNESLIHTLRGVGFIMKAGEP
jgi:two-component system, OmpR family, copper resistance phosphate regulon response regulator CusR